MEPIISSFTTREVIILVGVMLGFLVWAISR
jgi:hypothetical protein